VKQLEFHIYMLSGNRLLRKGVIEFVSVLSIFLSSVKFGVDQTTKLSNTREFRENLCNERHTVLESGNESLSVSCAYFVRVG
jgi:hypothetical protein